MTDNTEHSSFLTEKELNLEVISFLRDLKKNGLSEGYFTLVDDRNPSRLFLKEGSISLYPKSFDHPDAKGVKCYYMEASISSRDPLIAKRVYEVSRRYNIEWLSSVDEQGSYQHSSER